MTDPEPAHLTGTGEGALGSERVGPLSPYVEGESPNDGPLLGTRWTDAPLPRENRLLASLPRASRDRLRPKLQLVDLGLKDILWEKNGPIPYVYFPLNGVISMVAIMQDASSVEVGTVGNEGMAGVPVFLGAARTNIRAFSQVPGAALRMASDDLRAEVGENVALREMLHRYAQALFSMMAQASACHRIHSAAQRLALWIAMCHDRVGVDTFPITQEFLAQMVGVQRTTVKRRSSASPADRSHRLLTRCGLSYEPTGARCHCLRVPRRHPRGIRAAPRTCLVRLSIASAQCAAD